MKRHRFARQIGLTSTVKMKRPSSPYYQGGSDPNKGRKKRMWYEYACPDCGKKHKVVPGSNCKCSCEKTKRE